MRARARRGTGSIKKESDGRFSLRYYENGGQVRAPLRFEDRLAAELWNSERLVKSAKGEWQDPRRSTELLRTFGERELAQRTYTPLSRQQAEWQWRKYVDPAFGDWSLSKIKFEDVQEWRSGLLANGTGEPTVRLLYNLLKSLMTAAVEQDKITRNPCRIKGASTPRTPKRRHVSYDQCMTIIDNLPPHLTALATVAWWSAARRGEILGIQWRDVNLATGELHICRQIVQPGTELLETEPKWHSDRFLDISGPGLNVLKQHRKAVGRSLPSARVFTNHNGGDLTPHALGQAWVRARTKAELPSVAFHDLRRSSATAMLASGMTIHDVKTALGHENITTTQRYLLDDPTTRPARAATFAAHVAITTARTDSGTASA